MSWPKTVWVAVRTHAHGWEVVHCSPSRELAEHEASRLVGTGGVISLHSAELKAEPWPGLDVQPSEDWQGWPDSAPPR